MSRKRRKKRWWFLILAIVALMFLASRGLSIYVSALWFGSLGYAQVYWYMFRLKIELFVIFFLITVVILRAGFWLIERAFAPFAFEDGLVRCIIAEAGDHLDQLPLMQHALMRTWKIAGGPTAQFGSALTLTHRDYRSAGGIAEALSKHADAAWTSIEQDAAKANLARRLFLLLADVHPDGKIVRRRPLVSEVQAVTGANIPAIEEIVLLFQSDDRNFLLPPLKPGGDGAPANCCSPSLGFGICACISRPVGMRLKSPGSWGRTFRFDFFKEEVPCWSYRGSRGCFRKPSNS